MGSDFLQDSRPLNHGRQLEHVNFIMVELNHINFIMAVNLIMSN